MIAGIQETTRAGDSYLSAYVPVIILFVVSIANAAMMITMSRMGLTRRGRLLVAVGLALIYAWCYSAIKAGLPHAPPLRFGGFRAVIASGTLFVLLLLTRQPALPPRRLWPGIAALAATGTLLAFAAMFSSPGRTGAGIASVLGNTTPLLILALAAPLLGEPITRGKVLALVLGLAGATLVASPALLDPAREGAWGALLPLMAAAGFAISSIVVKLIDSRGAVVQVAAWQLLLGGVPLLMISGAFERGATVEWTATFVAILIFLAVIGTAFTTAVWYWLVQQGDVGRLSLALFIVPAAGLGIALVAFGERLRPLEILGVGLVLASLGMVAFEQPAAAAAAGADGTAD